MTTKTRIAKLERATRSANHAVAWRDGEIVTVYHHETEPPTRQEMTLDEFERWQKTQPSNALLIIVEHA